jgi:hypothetical protein
MADAEDLKSSGDFSSCGFDSHPGHHFLQCYRQVQNLGTATPYRPRTSGPPAAGAVSTRLRPWRFAEYRAASA